MYFNCISLCFYLFCEDHSCEVRDGKRPIPDGKAIPKPSAAPTRPTKVQKTDNGAAGSESKSQYGAPPETPADTAMEKDKGEKGDKGDGAFPEFMSLGAPKPKAKLAFPASLPLKQLAKVLQVPPAPEAQAPDILHQFHVGPFNFSTFLADVGRIFRNPPSAVESRGRSDWQCQAAKPWTPTWLAEALSRLIQSFFPDSSEILLILLQSSPIFPVQ